MEIGDMYKTVRSFTWKGRGALAKTSELIMETPLEIIINEAKYTLIMFTPGLIRELVFGFMFTEGLIDGVSDVEECIISPVQKEDGERVIEVRVSIPSRGSGFEEIRGKRISYSSCGICGKEDYYELRKGLGRVKSRQRFSVDVIKGFSAALGKLQPLYHKTGGAHAAILFDHKGNAVLHGEDMGRHNALDKVIGAALIKSISCEDKAFVSSGRASLEMILKTARAGCPLFVAISRPTSSAVEAAKFYNITLMDMARDTNRIYSHVRRIEGKQV